MLVRLRNSKESDLMNSVTSLFKRYDPLDFCRLGAAEFDARF